MEKEINCLGAIEETQKKMISIIRSNKSSIAALETHAHLLAIKGKGELNNGVSVHNVRRNAESLKIYFDMMEMLLDHIGEDIKDIRKKEKLQTVVDDYEKMEAARRAEKAEKERIRRQEKKEGAE